MKKQKLLAMLLCVVFALSLIACAPSTAPATEGEAAAPADAAPADGEAAVVEPAATKDLVVAFDQEPTNLDYAIGRPYVILWAADPCNDFLFVLDDAGENVVGSLVEKYEWTTETDMAFTLREAYFHDSSPVTVADVAFTLCEYIQNPTVASRWGTSLACISSVEEISQTEGVIHLSEIYAPLLDTLTWVPIYKKGTTAEQQATAPVGCGAFKFVEWAADQYVKFEKFDQYWDADSIKLDTITIKFYGDANAAKTALLAGEADILYWIAGTDITTFSNTEGFYTFSAPYGSYYCDWNVAHNPALADPNVGMAIKYAIDRDLFVETCLAGNGEPSWLALNKSSVFYDTNWEYGFDLEKAKEYMAASAYPDGFTCSLIAPSTATESAMAETLAYCLQQIGIKCEISTSEYASFSEPWLSGNYDLAICGYVTPTDPDPTMFEQFAVETNHLGYSNAEAEAKMVEARTTNDTAKRKALYSEALGDLLGNGPVAYILNENRTAVCADYVSGLIMFPARYKWNKVDINK